MKLSLICWKLIRPCSVDFVYFSFDMAYITTATGRSWGLHNGVFLLIRGWGWTSISECFEQIYKSIDKREISVIFLHDLSKAFDCVNHNSLLNKLVQLNIDSTGFESYLHEGTESVKIYKISESKSNLYGGPHGSILGPILFNIFINDNLKIHSLTGITIGTPIYAVNVQLLFSGTPNVLELLIRYAETTWK